MMSVGHVLDHVPDHVLDHMIIGLVTTALYFVTSLPILINWKRDNYNSILVIVDWLTKMVHYKLVKITLIHASL